MDNIRLSAELIALIGIGATLLVAIIAGHIALVRRIGDFPTRDEMRAEIRPAEERLRREAQEREERQRQEMERLWQEMRAMEERLQQQIQALHVEIRESTERIIDALASHRHPVPDGEPVFTRPA